MAKTGAERQAAYRARQSGQDSGQRRISTWINTDAAQTLEKLADRYGVTLRGALEMLLMREVENVGKHQKNIKNSARRATRKKDSLPCNDLVAPVSAGPVPEIALPGNVEVVQVMKTDPVVDLSLPGNELVGQAGSDSIPEISLELLLPSNEMAKVVPEIRTTDEPAPQNPGRGEQYSLEL